MPSCAGWVDRVGLVQYPGYFAKLPPCWPNHPEAVTELSNVMTEWIRVYGDEDNRHLAAALWWHERWLPGFLARLTAAVKCDVAGCRRLQKPVGAIATALRLTVPEGPGRAFRPGPSACPDYVAHANSCAFVSKHIYMRRQPGA